MHASHGVRMATRVKTSGRVLQTARCIARTPNPTIQLEQTQLWLPEDTESDLIYSLITVHVICLNAIAKFYSFSACSPIASVIIYSHALFGQIFTMRGPDRLCVPRPQTH